MAEDRSIAERQHLASALEAAIRSACAARGYSEPECAALIGDCLALDAAGQVDMLDHFRAEAQRFGASGEREGGQS